MSEEIRALKLTDYKFEFNLGSGDCYRLRTGGCSLDKPFLGEVDSKPMYCDESSFEYCRRLFLHMKDNQMDPIQMSGFSCGQHRACIAKRTGLVVQVSISTPWDIECRQCYFKRNSLIYRIKAFVGMTKEFTDEKHTISVQNIGRRLVGVFQKLFLEVIPKLRDMYVRLSLQISYTFP